MFVHIMNHGPIVSISNQSVSDTVSSGTAYAYYGLLSDGRVYVKQGPTVTYPENWIDPTAFAPGSYKAYVTVAGTALEAGSAATGSEVAISTSPIWKQERSATGTDISILTVQIRDASSVVLSTASIQLTAELL